jgi:hypothetical protein
MKDRKENNEPVHYCKLCLSISIKTIEFEKGANGEDRDLDYCTCCKGSDIGKASLDAWNMMYEEKYGEKFLDQKKTCR